jgi:orotate phosphoribosyltransferase
VNYRSVADLSQLLARAGAGLAPDVDVVVGVPRSGLLAASLLALHMDRPFTDVDGLVAGRIFPAGERRDVGDPATFLARPRKVLVLDDSVYTGLNVQRTRKRIEQAALPHQVRYAAAYAHPDAVRLVDLHLEVVAPPRMFEWNALHGPWIPRACVDIDGVLCPDPGDRDDDGPLYRDFLSTTEPLYAIGRRPGWLVTCRLEKYRSLTEAWLAERGIEYGELRMLDLPDAATRRALRPYARFKAEVYRETGAEIFIESSPAEAAGIAQLSGRPVYCVSTREMFMPGGVKETTYRAGVEARLWSARGKRLIARVGDKLASMLGGR